MKADKNNLSFNQKPSLTGETLSLRALKLEDFDTLYTVVSDPLIWEQTPYKDRYQLDNYQQWFDAAIKENALILIDKRTNTAIGSSRYYEIDEPSSEVAIGYTFIARDYWGGATNKELKTLMLNYAFQSFETVWLHIAEDNTRSRKAAEKIGAVLSHQGEKNGLPYCWYKLKTPLSTHE